MESKSSLMTEERTHTKWTAYLPVRYALIISSMASDDISAALMDVVESSGTISYDLDGHVVPITFDVANQPDFFPEYRGVPFEELRSAFVILRATAESDHVVGHFYDSNTGDVSTEVTLEQRIDASKYAAAFALQRALFEIVLASNLARPGALMPEGGAIFCDGVQRLKIPRWLNPIDEASENTRDVNWPSLKTLSFRDVWTWLINVPHFRNGAASSELGRALAAFSFLFVDSVDGAHPFRHGLWAILGLEAIYGEGTEQITRLLVERTNAFLGEQLTHKKALKEMYSFRSRFLHGDMNFPYSHYRYDAADLVDRFYAEATLPESLAIRVLIATLQRMAEERRYDLTFKTKVDPPPAAQG